MCLRKMVAASIFVCLPALATASDDVKSTDTGVMWYAGIGQVAIDSASATRGKIKDSATYIRLAVEGRSQGWLYGGGISGYFYSDKNKFSQGVEDQFGNRSTEDSSASAVNLYGEAGIAYPVSASMSADFLAGYEFVAESSRAISNCTDCASEDIDVDAGVYVAPRIRYQVGDKFTMSLSYQQYLTGDVENAIALYFGWTY